MTEIHTRPTSVHREITDRLAEQHVATINECLAHLVSSGHHAAARSLRAHFVEDGEEERDHANLG